MSNQNLLAAMNAAKEKMRTATQKLAQSINDVDNDTDDNKRLAEQAGGSTAALKQYIDGQESTYGAPAPIVRNTDVLNSWTVPSPASNQVASFSLAKSLKDDFDSLVTALSGLDGDPNAATPAERLAELVAWANAHSDQFDVLQTANSTRNGFMTAQHVTDLYNAFNRLDIGTTPASALAAIGAAPASHTHDYLPLAGGTVTGIVTLSSTSAATTTTSGALRVSGGVGVAGNMVAERTITTLATIGTNTTGFDLVYNSGSQTLDFIKRG